MLLSYFMLEGLGRLGQGVELVGAHAARDDEVAGAFGRGIDQVGGFDLQETFVAQEAANLLGHLVTQDHVALQGRTAQVDEAGVAEHAVDCAPRSRRASRKPTAP